jgi:hypothetical protein
VVRRFGWVLKSLRSEPLHSVQLQKRGNPVKTSDLSIIILRASVEYNDRTMPFPKTYRTNLWWAVIVGCIVGLLAGKGTITRSAILALIICGGTAGFLVAWEHKWLKRD